MAASVKSGIIGAAAGVAITFAAIFVYNKFISNPVVEKKKIETETVQPKPPVVEKKKIETETVQPKPPAVPSVVPPVAKPVPMKPIEKKTVKPQAIDRVHSKIMKGRFDMTGRGSDAKWGIAQVANFQHTMIVLAESEIISKKSQRNGMVKVVEKRTFNNVQDSIVVSDVDFKLSLNTLPIATFSSMIDGAAASYTSITGDKDTGALVVAGKEYLVAKLRAIDGIGIRQLLGFVGLKPSRDIEDILNGMAAGKFTQALGVLRSISGKSYIVTYYQEKNGVPMMVTFKNGDGSEVTDEEEKMALRRVNAFLDYSVVPDGDCRPGNSWKIAAEDMQEIFDPFVDGTYTGSVTAVRRSNAENGDWVIDMKPRQIKVIANNGSTTGSLNLKSGKASINPEKLSVNEMFVEGTANLTKLSKHHLLFTARVEGNCNFQGRLITSPKEK